MTFFGLNADFFAMLLDCDGGTNKLRIYLIAHMTMTYMHSLLIFAPGRQKTWLAVYYV